MGVDRGHYSVVSYSNVGIDLGTQVCTAGDLTANLFTYEGFQFVSTDGGNTWIVDNSIEYAVAPPLQLRRASNNRLYICYQNGDLAPVTFGGSLTSVFSIDQPGNQYNADSNLPSGFNIGNPMVDMRSSGESFDFEDYQFKNMGYAAIWEISPAVTE